MMPKTTLVTGAIAVAKLWSQSSIRISSVCPGWVQTNLGGPDNRAAAPLTPDEAARTIVDTIAMTDEGPSDQFVDADGSIPW